MHSAKNISADSFLSCPPTIMDIRWKFNEISAVVALVIIPFAMIIMFFGYRLKRLTFFLCGFFSGSLITFAIVRDQVDSMQLPYEGALGVSFAGGLIVGFLCLGLRVLGCFIVGMNACFLIAAAIIGIVAHFLTINERSNMVTSDPTSLMFSSPFPSRWLPIGCIVLSCLLGGMLTIFRPRVFIIIGSALIGSATLLLTFGFFLEANNPLRPIRFVAASLIGTRYMHTHYGRYLFGYVPAQFSDTSAVSDTSSTKVVTAEKKDALPAFLCWSDFVLCACWILIAGLVAVCQFACISSKRHRVRTQKRGKHVASSKRKSIHDDFMARSHRQSADDYYSRPIGDIHVQNRFVFIIIFCFNINIGFYLII